MQIFISHSSVDAEQAAKICELLEINGTKCFIAPRDIRSGKEYAEELVNGIDSSSAVILLMSENANHSPHVLREVERAVSRSIPILVYKLEEVALSKSMEYFLMTHQWISAQSDENYEDILRSVEDLKKDEEACQNAARDNGATADRDPENDSSKTPRKNTDCDTTEASDKAHPRKRTIFSYAAAILAFFVVVIGISALINNMRNSLANTIAVGDTITFGSYNDTPIEWRVLKLSDDKKHAVLISADVLTMKAYDAAEGGKYNWYDDTDYWSQDSAADQDMILQTLVRGNSDWSASNIRTWLNCTDEVVDYTDQAPLATAMAEHKNGYQHEAGFLHDFTEDELAAITETQNITKGNALSESETITTTDLVYLLSLEELQWFDDAKISKFALPTEASIEQDESGWYLLDYDAFHIDECPWWLREPVEGTSSKCYLVSSGYTEELLRQENVGLEGFGIRPALTVDLRKLP